MVASAGEAAGASLDAAVEDWGIVSGSGDKTY